MSERKRSYYLLSDDLDDAMETAALAMAEMEPNGHDDQGTYYWPHRPRAALAAITEVVQRARKNKCECPKSKRRLNGCDPTEERAARSLRRLGVDKKNSANIARILAALAHSTPTGDRAAD